MKKCIICSVELSRCNTTWYRQKNYIHKCNDCIREEKRLQAKKSWDRDPEASRERGRRYKERQKKHNPKRYSAGQMCASAAKRSRALGLAYDIKTEYVLSICPDTCPILGYDIKYGGGEKSKKSASLDRIDPELGYVMGNVQVVSLLANLMKSESSKEDQIKFARWVLSKHSR